MIGKRRQLLIVALRSSWQRIGPEVLQELAYAYDDPADHEPPRDQCIEAVIDNLPTWTKLMMQEIGSQKECDDIWSEAFPNPFS